MIFRSNVISILIVLLLASPLSSCRLNRSKNASHTKVGVNSLMNALHCTDLMDAKLNPLGPYEWHLHNYGNSSFATQLTSDERISAYGQDINAYSVLKDYCLSGKGVHVAVVDSGMEISHPSLAPNVENEPYKSTTWSINFLNNKLLPNDPSPIFEDDDDHGTMVAGIIAMRSNLGFGGSGVAPRAKLAAYNVLHEDAEKFRNYIESLGGSDASKHNDVFNLSFGPENVSQRPMNDPIQRAAIVMYKMGTRSLRNGKGAIYVKAAGNGFSILGDGSSMQTLSCLNARLYKVSCQNSNMILENSVPEVITVGAVDIFGKKGNYSTTGASLWVVAPGGDFAVDKLWIDSQMNRFDRSIDWDDYPKTAGRPGIMTTDMIGPLVGASRKVDMDKPVEIFAIRNSFNAGLVSENLECNYTNTMAATSSATPIVSGAIAIILEANPNLSWRDVKHILASTSTKVDPDFPGVTANFSHGSYQLEQGWVTNAALYHFSNWYGFGRVNLKEAVDLARNYQYPLGQYIERDWWPLEKEINLDVPSCDLNGVTQIVNVPKIHNLIIESVQILVSLKSDIVGDAAIELISPSGTKSIVWHAGNGFAFNGDIKDMIMQSNAFYGEKSEGDWLVRVINTGMTLNNEITWTAFQLRVTGHDG